MTPPHELSAASDQDLVASAREGHMEAYDQLVRRHRRSVFAFIRRLVRDRDLAEDLTQDVFVRAYRAFGRLRPDSNHRAWLFKIATNCAYTALRRGRRQAGRAVPLDDETRQIPAADPSPETWVVAGEALDRVRQAIAGLPIKQRMAIVLRYVQELDYATIAQALGCSQDSARANVYQALRRLRREFSEESD